LAERKDNAQATPAAMFNKIKMELYNQQIKKINAKSKPSTSRNNGTNDASNKTSAINPHKRTCEHGRSADYCYKCTPVQCKACRTQKLPHLHETGTIKTCVVAKRAFLMFHDSDEEKKNEHISDPISFDTQNNTANKGDNTDYR
jgi:hypothetical protein